MKGDFLIRSGEVSDPRFGEYPGARDIDEMIKKGLVLVDKPSGPTSHQVAAWVKDILEVKKAGHTGTLDPKVTGLLLIALDKSNKVMPVLKGLDKEYIALMRLHGDVAREKITEVLEDFRGEIKQIPPKKSAVKREERIREIKELELLEKDDRNVLLDVQCEAGTYIRKLVHDMGKELGVRAHMEDLRRTSIGPFTEDRAVKLQTLKDAYVFYREDKSDLVLDMIMPVEMAADLSKTVVIKDTAVAAVCHGAPLGVGGISRIEQDIEKGDSVTVLSLKGELVAVGEAGMSSDEMYGQSSGKAVSTKNVVMKRGIYPKGWE